MVEFGHCCFGPPVPPISEGLEISPADGDESELRRDEQTVGGNETYDEGECPVWVQ